MQKTEKYLKPWHIGTHLSLRVLCESYLMNANMTGLVGYQESLHPCALAESSLNIGRLKYNMIMMNTNHIIILYISISIPEICQDGCGLATSRFRPLASDKDCCHRSEYHPRSSTDNRLCATAPILETSRIE